MKTRSWSASGCALPAPEHASPTPTSAAPDGVSWLWLWSPSAMHGAMHAAIPAARSAARRRHVHPQRVVEAIEVVEEADDGRQLDDLPFVPVRAQLRPHLFIHAMCIRRHALRQRERRALGGGKQLCVLVDMIHRIEQRLRRSQLLCQSSM